MESNHLKLVVRSLKNSDKWLRAHHYQYGYVPLDREHITTVHHSGLEVPDDELFNYQLETVQSMQEAHEKRVKKATKTSPLVSRPSRAQVAAPEQFKVVYCHSPHQPTRDKPRKKRKAAKSQAQVPNPELVPQQAVNAAPISTVPPQQSIPVASVQQTAQAALPVAQTSTLPNVYTPYNPTPAPPPVSAPQYVPYRPPAPRHCPTCNCTNVQ